MFICGLLESSCWKGVLSMERVSDPEAGPVQEQGTRRTLGTVWLAVKELNLSHHERDFYVINILVSGL